MHNQQPKRVSDDLHDTLQDFLRIEVKQSVNVVAATSRYLLRRKKKSLYHFI